MNMEVNAQELVIALTGQRNAAMDAAAALEAKVRMLEYELKTVKDGHGTVLHKEIPNAGNPTE